MDIIPSTVSKRFTSDTTFSKCDLIFDAYYKIPKTLWYGENYKQKKLWISSICSNIDMEKYTNLDGGI